MAVDWLSPTVAEEVRSAIPRNYNAATHFIDRHLGEGRGEKIAIIDDQGSYSFAQLARRVNRAGNLLRSLGVAREQRVMLCVADGIDFVALFWGAAKIGAVPVPVSTLLKPADYDFMLRDSRALLLAVSAPLLDSLRPMLNEQPYLETVLVCGTPGVQGPRLHAFDALLDSADDRLEPVPTVADDTLYWLYTSGTTGKPKGAVHRQDDMEHAAELHARKVLGINESDVIFCASKLPFSYGLLCAQAFPLHVGATTVLTAERPTPETLVLVMKRTRPTVFCSVPTLFARIVADPEFDILKGSSRLRFCVSAGEPLPEAISRAWAERFGVEIFDGIGATEVLIIFISNGPGEFRYDTSGKPVPGCAVRLINSEGGEVSAGEIGDLWVSTPSNGAGYWNNRAVSVRAFVGAWFRTGDKYWCDSDGYYHYAGRSDDMLKANGMWISPFEIESALLAHPDVLDAALVGVPDLQGLPRLKAFVVLRPGVEGRPELAEQLRSWLRERLAHFKCPQQIEFRKELPMTATGKVQRFKLRDELQPG